jgi:hypothetical protein
MVYLHLQSRKRSCIISPLDSLLNGRDLDSVPIQQQKPVQRSVTSIQS